MEGPEITVAEAVIDNGTFGTRTVRFETGRLAKQAGGSVAAYLDEDTMLLSTTTAGKSPREGFDFFPLTVDVEERMYAAGKIPGSFFRREGRPSTDAILTCRLIDRPLRPTFTKGLRNEVQVVITVLALNPDHQYDVLAINAASASTQISGLPFSGPIGGVRVSLIDDQWVAFPNFSDIERSTFDMVVAGRIAGDDVAIMMVEAESTEQTWDLVKTQGKTAPTEEIVAQGLEASKGFIKALCDAQSELAAKAAKPVQEFPIFLDYEDDVYAAVEAETASDLDRRPPDRGQDRARGPHRRDQVGAAPQARRRRRRHPRGWRRGPFFGRQKEVSAAYRAVQKKLIRQRILKDKVRIDGRGLADIRALSAEVEVLPRVHGSAIFERGETQIMGVTTLNMLRMEQQLDTLSPVTRKRYMHNYNFPPYSTGETGRVGFAEASRDRPRCARRACPDAGAPDPRGVPLRDPPGVRGSRLQRLDVDGLGLRLDPVDAQRRCAAARPGRRHRDGPGLGRGRRQDRVRRPHRHPRCRGRVRRHGLQGRRHP